MSKGSNVANRGMSCSEVDGEKSLGDSEVKGVSHGDGSSWHGSNWLDLPNLFRIHDSRLKILIESDNEDDDDDRRIRNLLSFG